MEKHFGFILLCFMISLAVLPEEASANQCTIWQDTWTVNCTGSWTSSPNTSTYSYEFMSISGKIDRCTKVSEESNWSFLIAEATARSWKNGTATWEGTMNTPIPIGGPWPWISLAQDEDNVFIIYGLRNTSLENGWNITLFAALWQGWTQFNVTVLAEWDLVTVNAEIPTNGACALNPALQCEADDCHEEKHKDHAHVAVILLVIVSIGLAAAVASLVWYIHTLKKRHEYTPIS